MRCLIVAMLVAFDAIALGAEPGPLEWPPVNRESRPHAYWWWMGSAVDRENISRELHRYRDAGMGGVHIIPIYGAKGWENRYIPYLSARWMEMLRHTVAEGRQLDLNVDMTTGTGWCFGGPGVTDEEANASVVSRTISVEPGGRLAERFDRRTTQALVAFAADGRPIELTSRILEDGTVDWTADAGPWQVFHISQRPSGQRVKRASPGGEGHMLNLFYAPGMRNYLRVFEDAFARYDGPKPRAMYHDSYEYRSDWAPDLFAQFERRRGYRLQGELAALLGKPEDDRAARVKCDYRETLSDIMAEETLPMWVRWSHDRGMITRNEAHGSPGNLLDLYALSDIPETEMFYRDRNPLICMFASSAAHVAGRRLVSAETGTWLKEHFTETLADMKVLLDDLFLSGVNHVVYHGTCYSPDEAPWPGWLFYASTEMNPRNSVWRDVPALNTYAARCQSILQHGNPDGDILLYWPIHDFWQRHGPLEQKLTVHARAWFEEQPIGKAAELLWRRGFAFDYISDRQIAGAQAGSGAITVAGGRYRTIAVPACRNMPEKTLARLLELVSSGATVIFEQQLPGDVPGWGDLGKRRSTLRGLLGKLQPAESGRAGVRTAAHGAGRVLVGDLEAALGLAGVVRETMTDHAGMRFIRRSFDGGRHYFVANRGASVFEGWLPLSSAAKSVVAMDPLSGRTGIAAARQEKDRGSAVWLRLEPGDSIILRALEARHASGPAWRCWRPTGQTASIGGPWQVKFLQGGPELPAALHAAKLVSWTELGGEALQRFAGTGIYSVRFDAPPGKAALWLLDLGKVCQSARVRLNGVDLGTLLVPPFRIAVPKLRAKGNLLEVEVTSVSANRIRDLDRQKVPWKNFHDINFVNIDYKPFDASGWPLADAGLLGPVSLVAAEELKPSR